MAQQFTMVPWAQGSNVYEVNIRQYTPEGTFQAFAEHLPRLQEMGVEILWLMPVTPISMVKRQGTLGSYYACSSYTSVNLEFGTMDDLRALVRSAHHHGMKVIIDWVANHTGCDHHWTIEHPEWYHRNEKGEFYDRNGWADVIDLDFSQSCLRSEMIACMKHWINECDIDGFRCDMAHLVPLDFWQQARKACDVLKPLFWLAETDDANYFSVFDASYAWSWMHKSEQYFKGHCPFHELVHETKRMADQPAGCVKLMFTSNHDENSWNGTEYEKYGEAAKALAVLSCTSACLPLIYSGQELPNLRRLKFFDKDVIEWEKGEELHWFYRSLLGLRQHCNALRYGAIEWLPVTDSGHVICFIRKHESRVVLVMLNLGGEDKVQVQLSHPDLHGVFTSAFSGLPYSFHPGMTFELSAWGYLVYSK